MLTIYGVYRSRASRTIWLANELGIPFKHVPVMQLYRLSPGGRQDDAAHEEPEFLKVNPNGHIPADRRRRAGAERVAGDQPLPRQEARRPAGARQSGRGRTDGHVGAVGGDRGGAAFAPVLYHRVGKPPAERDPKIAAAAIEALRAPFAVLDKQLAASGYIVGGRFTVADINTAEVVRYAMAGAGAVRGRPAREGLARRLPRAAGVQGDDGDAGEEPA